MECEKFVTPHVPSVRESIGKKKPPREGYENTKRYALIQWMQYHMGEWLTRREIAEAVGKSTTNVDDVLADMESPAVPFLIVQEHSDGRPYYMAIPKGRGDVG